MADATPSPGGGPEYLLRPMTSPEVIAAAFRLYRDHLAVLVMIALLPHLVLVGLGYLLEGSGLAPGAALAVLMGITVVLNGIVLAAMTHALGASVLGRAPTVAEAYRHALGRRVVTVIVTYLVMWVIITLGFFMLIVPGFIIGGLFLPAVPAVVLEGEGPFPALWRSVELMRERLLQGTGLFAFIILVSGVLPLLFQALVGAGPLSPLLSAVLGAVTLPLAYGANVLFYFSLRAREGYAPEQLERELAAP